MTRIIHKQAVQAHAVPRTAYMGGDIFPPYRPEVVEQEYDPDWFPPGATAQNGMRPDRYRCDGCGEVLWEAELTDHDCG